MRLWLAVSLVVWCAVTSVTAQESGDAPAKVFSWIGATGRTLEGMTAVEIPVTLAGEAPALRVRQVTRDGTAINVSDAFDVVYANEAIVVTPKKGAEKPGTYVVHIAATAPKVKQPETIDVTLTRPTPAQAKKPVPARATIEVDSSLYVDRIIDVPWMRVTVEPRSWVVRETGGKYAMTPTAPEVKAAIRAKSSRDLGQLRVTFPTVQPGREAEAKLAIDGNDVWLGNANATVKLQSATLEKTPVYTVVVRSRLAYGWLVLAILGGIGLGYVVKKHLEVRGAVLAAKAAALEEAEKVRAYEVRIRDAEVQRALLAQRMLLENATGTAETVKKVTEEVKTKVKEIVDKAEEHRTAAKTKLDALRSAIGNPDEQFMPLRSLVRGTATALDAQKTALERGEIHQPLRELARIEDRILGDVREELPRISSEITSALPKFGTWPELALGEALTSIDTKLGTLNQRPLTVEELKAALNTTAELSSLLRYNVGTSGVNDVWETVKYVRAELEREGVLDDTTRDALLVAEREVYNVRSAELPREIGKVAAAVQHAHEALGRVILAVYRKKNPTATDKPEGLDTGAFRKALMAALQKPAKGEEQAESGVVSEGFSGFERESVAQTELRGFDDGIGAARSAEEIAKSLRLVHGLRDWIYGALVLLGGLIIFHGSFIGTLEDLAAAFLWGFSVDLTAATLTTYTTPLLARRPFPKSAGGDE